MKRQAKIDFYQGLDTEMLILMVDQLHCFIDEYAAAVERARADVRLVQLVLKGRKQDVNAKAG